MKYLQHIWRLVLVMAAVAVAAPVFAQDASLLTYEGPDRDQKLIQAAKKEGSLMLYTTLVEKNLRPITDAFEKKYGVKVVVWRAGTDRVLQRTVAEAAAGRYEVDALHFGTAELEALHREKLLQPVKSTVFSQLLDGSVPAHHEWAATIMQVYVQSYNTNLVKKADLPKTYEDFLDPKWKGKLGIEMKAWPWYSTLVTSMGEKKGIQLFRDIVERNGISPRRGNSLLNNLVSAGEIPLALTVYSHMPIAAKEKGAPIDWFVLSPAIAKTNGIAIARHAPHPNAALLFYEYLLSADGGQKAFASIDYVPTNKKVPSPLGDLNVPIKLVDPVVALDQSQKWNDSFDDVFNFKDGKEDKAK